MLELSPKSQLMAMIAWKSISAVSRTTGLDRGNIRDLLSGDRGIGPVTGRRIQEAYSKALNERYGVPALRFPTMFDVWLGEIRAIATLEDKAERRAGIRKLYLTDKLSVMARETLTEPGQDQDATVRRAAMNIVGANINWRAAPVLTMAVERHARALAPVQAVEQYGAAAALLRHARERQSSADDPGDKGVPEWSSAELQGLIGYARFNQLAVLSEFRHERYKENGGFSVFDDTKIEAYLQGSLGDVRDVLQLYPDGHPSRLVVAANTLVIGSLVKDASLALAGWRALAVEEPRAVDLRYPLPTHDRPLADSSQTIWLRKQFGLILPSVQ